MEIRIADKQEPGEGRVRVQDTDISKEDFGRQFSEPKPVVCHWCKGTGLIPNYDVGGMRPDPECNGDGISGYISYVYDEDMETFWELFSNMGWDDDTTDFENSSVADTNWKIEGKPWNIIINPYLYLVTIK